MKYLLILLLTILPTTTVNLIAVKGPYAVTDEQIKDIYSEAAYYYRLAGLNLRIRYHSVPIGDNLCRFWHYVDVPNRVLELYCFKGLSTRRKNVTIWITPPFLQQEGEKSVAYVAGIADVCGQFGTSNATEKSLRTGDSLLEPSAKALAHETLHIFCAKHVESLVARFRNYLCESSGWCQKVEKIGTIMHPNANSFQGRLPISRITKRQVKRWYTRSRRGI